MNPRTAFVNALIASRVVARYMAKKGMEFDTPEALQKYLKDHPKADKSMHSVKKPEKEEPKKEEPKGQDQGEGDDEGGSKTEWERKSMSWGEMPSKKDFEKHVREGKDDDDEPLWDDDKGFSVRLRGEDEDVASLLDLETDGKLESPEEVYDYVEKLKDFSEHDDEWYTEEHGIDPEDVERHRDAAMSLASSMMDLLGYEWI